MQVMERLGGEPRPHATISVEPDGEDLLVTMQLSREVDTLRLLDPTVVETGALQVLTQGVRFTRGALASDQPFSEVRFRLVQIPPVAAFQHQFYFRLGEGRMLFAPAIYPDMRAWDASLEFAGESSDWARLPTRELPRGYLFIGPPEMIIEQNGVRFARDPEINPELDAFILDAAARSFEWLDQTLGPADDLVRSEPFYVASRHGEQDQQLLANVTADGMVSLRFSNAQFDPAAPGAASYTRSLVLHEGVHFWQSGIVQPGPNTPIWFYEGGAEYLGAIGALELGWTDQEEFGLRLTDWLNRCRASLAEVGGVALAELATLDWSQRYDCGALLQTLTELYLADAERASSVAAGWRETIRLADEEYEGTYDHQTFAEAIGMADLWERPAIAAIVAESGSRRWTVVMSELERMGVGIAERSTPHLRARSLLMPLLDSACADRTNGEPFGFYWYGPIFQLDTPAGCGALAGSPQIAAVAGHPIATLDDAAYADLQAICTAGGNITIGLLDGTERQMPCDFTLGEPLTERGVVSLPQVPAFNPQ
ncbi:hypothetical protein [Aurantiacibacter sp. MUD61]|uniref:hypothetical protein n=1 Tax=Aurantiacibacter sp. MUD61 TaxID=3009083 RepID=UPI0022F0F3C5|nr:hypothetical protein [Aurantiacibacter sp. MUD61]